jgi:mannan endo-1,4-beta-mannosidase
VYAEDPTIFSWLLMNEPNFEPAEALRKWVVEMSAYIKSIDPHHLVSIGHGYVYYKFADLEIDSIDFGTWHGYPIHTGLSWQEINDKIDDLCAIGKRYGKPMLWEEFGYARKNPDQLEAYKTWLETVERNRDCAGWVVWRLVSKQKAGNFPKDEYDQFDVRNDGGPLFATLKNAAARLKRRTESSLPAPQ